jgi:hypothetical protein
MGLPRPIHDRRHVPTPPFSRDSVRFEQVRRARVYYRLVLGQPNPDELVAVLMENMPLSMARELVEELRLDLRPRPAERRRKASRTGTGASRKDG